jgi:hypothetical protein
MEPLPRVNSLVVMLSDHELEFIRQSARAKGIEPADLIRSAALDVVFADRRPQLAEPEALELTPESRGQWLVHSQNSTHYWDLDAMTYTSWRGESVLAEAIASEAEPVPIASIDRYPRVGGKSLVYYTDPGDGTECWRESSVVQRIERLGAPRKPVVEAYAFGGQVVVAGSVELFAINNSNTMTPGQACEAAFRMDERGDHQTAKQLWAAAAEADQQGDQQDEEGA